MAFAFILGACYASRRERWLPMETGSLPELPSEETRAALSDLLIRIRIRD
ncbi:MAG: hypothetical protein JWM16_1102 [Verrucomicrobiales bacterium]|nr:hypothetical protein [Verrucomicrobiales bacterium]